MTRTAAALATAALAQVALSSADPFIANVVSFGADPTGVSLSTPAIVSAVSAVSANGGGTLYFPPGTYLSAPFNLTSNTTLYLDTCTLRATNDFDLWDVIAPLPSYGRGRDFPGPRYTSFIHCFNCSNVVVTGNPSSGPGANVVDGQGGAWWAGVENRTLSLTPGHLIEFLWSTDVEVSHVTLLDSPFWNLHIWSSARVWVHDMAVVAPRNSSNTDGVDPDSSSDVLIGNVVIDNGDDCIAVKSGWNQAGVAYGVPTTNVVIRNMTCTTRSACLAIGSEMSGSVYNVHASGITCVDAGQLLNVKSCLGRGGVVANITLVDSVITGAVNTAIAVVDDYKDAFPPSPVDPSLIPSLGSVTVRNVTTAPGASVGAAGEFEGIGSTPSTGSIDGVTLQDVDLSIAVKGWACTNMTGSAVNVLPPPSAATCPQLA